MAPEKVCFRTLLLFLFLLNYQGVRADTPGHVRIYRFFRSEKYEKWKRLAAQADSIPVRFHVDVVVSSVQTSNFPIPLKVSIRKNWATNFDMRRIHLRKFVIFLLSAFFVPYMVSL